LSIHLGLGLPSGLFPSGFPTNILHISWCIIYLGTVLVPRLTDIAFNGRMNGEEWTENIWKERFMT
jgi:hypothetical protein